MLANRSRSFFYTNKNCPCTHFRYLILFLHKHKHRKSRHTQRHTQRHINTNIEGEERDREYSKYWGIVISLFWPWNISFKNDTMTEKNNFHTFKDIWKQKPYTNLQSLPPLNFTIIKHKSQNQIDSHVWKYSSNYTFIFKRELSHFTFKHPCGFYFEVHPLSLLRWLIFRFWLSH